MARHVYHWKHGWIPLDHEAALRKAHGDSARAAELLREARSATGMRSRRDVAHAVTDLPNVAPSDRLAPKHEIIAAAHAHGATDLLPVSWNAAGLPAAQVRDFRGGSAEGHLVTESGVTRFSDERAALHDRIIESIVAGHKAWDSPAFVMLGGGPASGKSKAAAAAASEFPDAVKIDPDEIKKMLPEYGKLPAERAAAFTHEESSYLAKRVTDAAHQSRAHVVLDAVGDSSASSVRSKVAKARAAGYSVHARYVTVPTDVAQERARQRGIKTGRVVPPEVIAGSHAGVSRIFPEVAGEFDTATLHDNTSEWRLVFSMTGGQVTVHDQQLWAAFRGKA